MLWIASNIIDASKEVPRANTYSLTIQATHLGNSAYCIVQIQRSLQNAFSSEATHWLRGSIPLQYLQNHDLCTLASAAPRDLGL